MNARIPAPVQPVLQDYLQQLKARVPDLLFGVYLHGSTVYGAFCQETSDIDVLVLTNGPSNEQDLGILEQLHADLRLKWPRWKLESSYVPQSVCARPLENLGTPHPFHKDGKFCASGIFDFNSPVWAANLWWMVKTRGVSLFGPEPAALDIQISAAEMIATNRRLVDEYWTQWTRPQAHWLRFAYRLYGLSKSSHVDWVVFGTLRTYFTLREHDITSKLDAAEYGLAHLPGRWHRLIRDCVRNRQSPVARSLPVRVKNAWVTAQYMRFILHACRRIP